jgi:pimeloyl-ACP methyl ester carboxylesterase
MYMHRIDPYVEEEGIRQREKLLFLMGDHRIRTKKYLLAKLQRGGFLHEVIPGAGHGLNLEQPQIVNQRIIDFPG